MESERHLDATVDAREPGRSTDAIEATVRDGDEEAAGLSPGVTLGRYVVLGAIGSGAIGIVYAGHDPELDRKVALKLLAAPQASADLSARMLREAQAMARLAHPNVVAVHDVGTHRGRVWVAMEYVKGLTLKDHFEQGIGWREALALMLDAGRGLAAAHAAGLVHRDIKPENIMIGDDGRVRVMDFGLARGGAEPTGEEATIDVKRSSSLLDHELTHQGSVLGTPAYMAPEGLRGAPTDARSDVYSWCVSCWEAVYGVRPHVGQNLSELRLAVHTEKPRPPPAARRVPVAIRRILERGLVIDPRARWGSMQELLAAIDRALRRRRSRVLFYGLAVALLVGLAGAALQRLRDDARAAECAAIGDTLARSLRLSGAPRIARAFAATEQPRASDNFIRAMPWLRRHVSAWGTTRRELCEEIAGRSPTPLEERELACLAERASAFEVLVHGVLAEAEGDTMRVAIQSAAGLPPVSACLDPRALAAAPALPEDPARRAVVAGLRERLQRAQIDTLAGRFDAAKTALAAIVDEAAAAEWRPAAREAQSSLGSIAHLEARYDEAYALLEGVVWEAEADGDDAQVARTASRLVDVSNHGLGRGDEALRWSRLALAALRRAGLDDDLPATDVLGSLAILQESRGDLDGAQASKERMLAIRLRVLGPDHPSVAATHNMLGVLYLLRGDPEAARRHHERALAIRVATLGAGHLEVAISHLNLAEVYLKTGDVARSIELSQRARDVLTTHFGADHPFTLSAIHNLANALTRKGDAAGALVLHTRVLAARERAFGTSHPEVGESWLGLADAHRRLGDDDAAEGELRRAVTIFEATAGPESLYVATTLLRLGDLLLDRGAATDALASLERASAIAEATAASAEVRGPILFGIGRALWESGGDRARARRSIDEGAALARGATTLDAEELAAIDGWIAANLSDPTGSPEPGAADAGTPQGRPPPGSRPPPR